MNILFLTMSSQMLNINESGIYTELVKYFNEKGHCIYIMVPFQRRTGRKTSLYSENNISILGVRTLNVSKTNVIEKGLGQVLLEYQFKAAFKKHISHVPFDLILYSTPPITFTRVIKYVKQLNPRAKSYLMLKDIFPQNAVDICMLKKDGLKGILYSYFRLKEKNMYLASDYIGCMSPANVRYLLKHNQFIDPNIVETCPNSFNVPADNAFTDDDRRNIRIKYGLPIDKPIFFYGGNLGKPQGIPFLLECLKTNKSRNDCHFLIVGGGTDYHILEEWINKEHPTSVTLKQFLPKDDYDKLARSCDIGMIFLDYRFTIPNFPSRLLNCLMQRKPILACTDPNSDTGSIAAENDFGVWCPSNNVEAFTQSVNHLLQADLIRMGENGYKFFLDNYTVEHTYNAIMSHFK